MANQRRNELFDVRIKILMQVQSGEENNWLAENKMLFTVLLRVHDIENFVYTCSRFFDSLNEGVSFR